MWRRNLYSRHEREQEADCGELCFFWPRLQIGSSSESNPRLAGSASHRRWGREFARGPARQAGSGDVGESGAKLLLGHHGEAVDSGMNQKTLETGNPPRRGLRFRLVVADLTPPQGSQSTRHFPCAALRLVVSAATVAVGGRQLSGMSTSVV